MTKAFNIDLYDGHLIFEDNGMKVLVDTGCPVTIGKNTSFDFMGKPYQCLLDLGGKRISDLSALMGYDIDVLMGMNIVENYNIQTDYKKKEITFSTDTIPFEPNCTVPILRGSMGEVCIELMVKGKCVRLALDTGAKISYIDEAFTKDETLVETMDDFNPLIGKFCTPIYTVTASIGNQSFSVKFGNLPPVMAMPLRMMGLYGAIGFDLFNDFKVLMDFKNGVILLRNNN